MDRQTTIERLSVMAWNLGGEQQETVLSAIELIEAQELVKPIFDGLSVTGACGNCGHELTYQKKIGENVLFEERYDYCPACGRKVLWE